MAKLGEMECGQFVGKVWHIGEDGFFQETFKQIFCLQGKSRKAYEIDR